MGKTDSETFSKLPSYMQRRLRSERLSQAGWADRVEFKAAKTPADMAMEITKEVIAKLHIKPGG